MFKGIPQQDGLGGWGRGYGQINFLKIKIKLNR